MGSLIMVQLMLHGSLGALVFFYQRNSKGITPNGGT